jgi:hypothetical protein
LTDSFPIGKLGAWRIACTFVSIPGKESGRTFRGTGQPRTKKRTQKKHEPMFVHASCMHHPFCTPHAYLVRSRYTSPPLEQILNPVVYARLHCLEKEGATTLHVSQNGRRRFIVTLPLSTRTLGGSLHERSHEEQSKTRKGLHKRDAWAGFRRGRVLRNLWPFHVKELRCSPRAYIDRSLQQPHSQTVQKRLQLLQCVQSLSESAHAQGSFQNFFPLRVLTRAEDSSL